MQTSSQWLKVVRTGFLHIHIDYFWIWMSGVCMQLIGCVNKIHLFYDPMGLCKIVWITIAFKWDELFRIKSAGDSLLLKVHRVTFSFLATSERRFIQGHSRFKEHLLSGWSFPNRSGFCHPLTQKFNFANLYYTTLF